MNGVAAEEAARIAEAFFFARDLFRPPSVQQWRFLTAPETGGAWEALARRLDLSQVAGLPRDAVDYETSYIAAFDAGAPTPPVPLIESHYNKREPVPRILHENILFYQSFGLRLLETSNEMADHLRHQLEFVGHLYKMEAEELRGRRDSEILAQVRAGRREFIERHLMSWLPDAAERSAKAPDPWIRNFIAMALNLVMFALQESAGSPQM